MVRKRWDEGPPGVKAWGRIRADAGKGIAEVHIYDEIGIWGVSAKGFAGEIAELDAETLNVYVNSPGGDAYDGIAIMNALRRHKAKIVITVDGLAASAASVICMAADELIMNRGSELMIHETWTWAGGPAADLRKAADHLDKLSDSYASAYAARAGGDRATWRAAMEAETWYSAEEAVEAKLADSWVDGAPAEEVAARASAFDLSQFGYRGRAAVSARAAVSGLPAAESGAITEEVVSVDFRADLIERLGLDAEATDEEITAALDAALEDDDAAVAALPAGVAAIEAGVLAQLQSDAAAGRAAQESLATDRRERAVSAAVSEGRIAPAARATWVERMSADEAGTVALLGTLAKNSVPVSELGHSDEPVSAEDSLYARAFGGENKEV